MSVEKTVVRSHLLNELGNKADDLLERYRLELKEAEGVALGVGHAQQAVLKTLAEIDVDIDAHKLDLETGKLLKTWILRASESVDTLRTQAVSRSLISRGKTEAAQQQLAFLKQSYDLEKARLAQYTSAPTHDNVIPIEGKERPLPLKARRLQEGTPPATEKKRRGKKPKAPPTDNADTPASSEALQGSMPPGPYKEESVSTEENAT